MEEKPARRYPPVYEKIIPLALSLIVLISLILLVVTIGIALGLFTRPF